MHAFATNISATLVGPHWTPDHPTLGARMNSFRSRIGLLYFFLILTIASVTLIRSSRAQSDASQAQTRSEEDKRSYRSAMEQADQKIDDEVKTHSELMKNLEHLTTEIGARLTGSPQMN